MRSSGSARSRTSTCVTARVCLSSWARARCISSPSTAVESSSARLAGLASLCQKRASLFPRPNGPPPCEGHDGKARSGRRGAQEFAHLAMRTDLGILAHSFFFTLRFQEGFFSMLGRFWEVLGGQNGGQNRFLGRFFSMLFSNAFWHRFWVDFWRLET